MQTAPAARGEPPCAGGGPAVYSVAVVLLRRGGIGLAADTVGAVVVAIVVAAASVPGCGGPLDSPTPPAPADAGTGGRRSVDASPVVRDAGPGMDAAIDVPWPIVPGCITGVPPAPRFSPTFIPPVTIGCEASSTVILRVADAAAQGMIFRAALDPPIAGFSATFSGDLCGFDIDTPIYLEVQQGAVHPGFSITTVLRISVLGPPPQADSVFALNINTAPIDFTVDPAVVDFGVVPVGLSPRIPIAVITAADSAPFQAVFPTLQQQGPFFLFPTSAGGPTMQPGDALPMLSAVLNPQAPGTFENTFLVSAFSPGIAIDPACGVIRTVTMRAQVVLSLP